MEVAHLAAGAAWNLNLWGDMATYVAAMRQDSVDTAFYKAVMATHEVNSPCINIGALAASKRPAHGQANGLLGLPQLWRRLTFETPLDLS